MKNTKRQTHKKWVRVRHKIIVNIAKVVLKPYIKTKYNVKIEKFKEQGNRQYLILFNHQTAFDQFLVALAIKGHAYFIASEDLFSNGLISKLLRFAVAPIPIKKQTSDTRAVMDCSRVARQGGTIALAPEGNRTYSGKTEHVNPAISKMAKLIKLPIAFFKIEGGYGVHPRWSDCIRKGKMRAYVSKVVEPEEFLNMSDDELYELIKNELYVNEACDSGQFYAKNSAEYLERILYVCPTCGLSKFVSKGDTITCCSCAKTARYLPDKTFKGDFPFKYINDWYEYQENFINSLSLSDFSLTPAFTDKAQVSEVILYKHKRKLFENATIKLYGDKITLFTSKVCCSFSFDLISGISVLGRNKLNVYVGDKVYQFKGDKSFNAVKFVNFYHRYKNIQGGEPYGKFLGL